MRKVKLQVTPITDTTLERQGWVRHISKDYNGTGDFIENREDMDSDEETDKPYFWTLPIPKERTDRYAPRFVSNSSDDEKELVSMGLKPNQYFIEILDFDGLGFCTTEEELEVLYTALTSKYIEE
jgi:hypothetical protein|tara:strand:+ start:17 stop:391 length:375 start_codon:yes stop_codon:yes gene_type:complete